MVRGRPGLQSGFWLEILWIQILVDVNVLCLALDSAQGDPTCVSGVLPMLRKTLW